MSTTSIMPYLPSCRVRVVGQQILSETCTQIELAPNLRFAPICSGCGGATRRIHSTYQRTVRDLSLGSHRTLLQVEHRRLRCGSCRATRSELHDFIAPSARVTKRMALYIAALCRKLSVSEVADHLGLDWKLVKRCDKEVLAEEFSGTDTAGLSVLAVDEIALKKGHTYMTVVLDYLSGRVVWMGEGRSCESLSSFFRLMSKQERGAIEAVAMDMWDPYMKAVSLYLPKARPIFDLFHVVASYHRAVLDVVRIAAYRKAEDQEERRYIKGSRFLLYKNEENLTEEQRPKLQDLLSVNREISVAYVLRDPLKGIWKTTGPWACRRALGTWCRLAKESGIPALIKFARMLKRHQRGIVAHAKYPIHTSKLEGVNNRIKWIKRRSYGFHDPFYFSLKVKQAFPGSACT